MLETSLYTMLPIALVLALVFAAFVVASDAAFVGARRLLSARTWSDSELFYLTRGVGPAAVSVLTYLTLLVLPGQAAWLLFTIPCIVFTILLLFGRSAVPALLRSYRGCAAALWRVFDPRPGRGFLAAQAAALLVLLALALGVTIPLTEHDSLVAAMESRVILRDLDLESYFVSSDGDPVTGFYVRHFRTPFLPCLYVWFGLVAGEQGMDLAARFVAPLYAALCLLVLARTVYRRRRSLRSASWAAFVLAATPIYFYLSYTNGIDPPRFHLSLLCLLWLDALLHRPRVSLKAVFAAGVVAGLALFCHLINLLLLGGGLLAFLKLHRGPLFTRFKVAAMLTAVAFLSGAQFHFFLHPDTTSRLRADFDPAWAQKIFQTVGLSQAPQPRAEGQLRDEADPSSAAATVPPSSATSRLDGGRTGGQRQPKVEGSGTILHLRGQGGALNEILFGRLQAFTAVEHFGFAFTLAIFALIACMRRGDRTSLDNLFLAASALTGLVVVLGVRHASWSNPRYIATLLPLACYFLGPWLAELAQRLSILPRARMRILLTAFVLMLPLVLATAIRGAKIEITNPGTFYSDFRNLRWLDYARQHPRAAVANLWEDYLGFRKTLRYWFTDSDTQLRNAHDSFAGVLYLRDHTPPDISTLVFRDARYFYYSGRHGMLWNHPRLSKAYRRAQNPTQLLDVLHEFEFDYILIDDFSEYHRAYQATATRELLSDPEAVELVFEAGTARVYRLLPRQEALPGPSAAPESPPPG